MSRIANGVNNAGGALQWQLGLINNQNKYLTAETFGFKINASGTSLRKKQVWIVEQDPSLDEVVYVKSHLGRYLSADIKGNATCSAESRGPDEQFNVQYHPDGSGRWAIRSVKFGYYFGGSEDALICYEKTPGATEWWTVCLAIHPQVSMQNVNRRRYARLDPTSERILCDEIIPWGHDALLTLVFCQGKYAIKAYDSRFLKRDGLLVTTPGPDTLFCLEIRSGQMAGMAFRDNQGKYLTAVGRDAQMQGRNKVVSKDELFTLEDSHAQAFLTAHNGKVVSIKQGIDLSANQDGDELLDSEIFQIEFDKKAQQWRIRTSENKFWSLEQASGIQNVGNEKSPNGLFMFEWQDDGAVCIRASNGRYVTAKLNGALYAVSESPGPKERFFLAIINRPLLILRCDFGFVGFKTASNPRLECNKSLGEVFYLQHTSGQSGVYYIRGANNKYFSVDSEGMVNADSAAPHPFMFELRGVSRMAIKAPNGRYIRGEQNGIFCANSDLQRATLWEF